MPDELADDAHGDAVAALHHVIRSEEWNYLSGTGAAARGRSRRMRRTRYAATAGSAVAVTGVAVLVASVFGGSGGSTAAAPAGPPVDAAPHHTSAAPVVPRVPAKTTESQPTMGTAYYDKWKSCPVGNLTVRQDPPGVHVPSTSTKVWVDACDRIMAALSALKPAADVSPAPEGWHVANSSTPPPFVPGRNEPVPAGATPYMGSAMYRVEDAEGTIVFSFHSGSYESGAPAGSVSVPMVDGLRAWVSAPKPNLRGDVAGGEFYVADPAEKHQAYALLMSAPSGFTAEDFQALVTSPTFEQMVAGNLAEPNF